MKRESVSIHGGKAANSRNERSELQFMKRTE